MVDPGGGGSANGIKDSNIVSGSAAAYGGSGGYAAVRMYRYAQYSGGGTGNPGGNGAYTSNLSAANNSSYAKGNNGTGGLLIIYCERFNNTDSIQANGVESRIVGCVSGGASRRWFCKYILQ